MIVINTITGSRLYGTDHHGSDIDLYMVDTDHKNVHTMMGDIDITLVNLDTFADQVKSGVPQAMEIMMQDNFLDTPYKPYIMSLRPNSSSLVHKYTGIMSNMIAMGTFKGYVHAMRLKINMDDYMDHGYFNPRPDYLYL